MIWWSFSCPLSSRGGNPNDLLSFRYRLAGLVVRKTNLGSILGQNCIIVFVSSRLTARDRDVSLLHRKLLMPSFLSLSLSLSSSLSHKKTGAQLTSFVSGMKSSPLLLHNDPLVFESNVYLVIFPQDLCRKTARSVPQNTLGCDKLRPTKCFFVIYCFLKLLRPSNC